MRAVVVVQARAGSTRLPRKVLAPVAGAPVLLRQIERLRAARTPAEVLVATTTLPDDDEVASLCREGDVPCYRGHPTDLLDRHLRAGLAHRADVVVKVPSDCPFIDPAVVDLVIGRYVADPARWDYVGNLHPATWPDGEDVEVVPVDVLAAAWSEARKPHEREHTTPFVWDQPERFACCNVAWPAGRDLSMTHRWTLDYPEDLALTRAVYDRLWSPSRHFTVDDVLALLDREPALGEINRRYAGVNWYRHHLGELRTVTAAETRTEDRT